MTRQMIVLSEEVVDALNERQLLAYIWLLRHAEGDTIKVSVRTLERKVVKSVEKTTRVWTIIERR